MKLHPKQISSVLALPGPERYEHFIKQVVDWEEVWGLYDDGWAMAGSDEDEDILPFWPHEDYAAICAEKDWAGFTPKSISLEEFMEDLLPRLKEDNVLPGIFFTPSGKSVTPSVDELLEHLQQELTKYL